MKKIDRVREEDIDYGEIPELDDQVFAQPLVEWPPKKETITMRVDADVLGWFKRQGSGYQTRMNRVLRHYMEVTGQHAPSAERPRRRISPRMRTSKRPG